MQTISIQKPNASFEEINKYQADECRSYNVFQILYLSQKQLVII